MLMLIILMSKSQKIVHQINMKMIKMSNKLKLIHKINKFLIKLQSRKNKIITKK